MASGAQGLRRTTILQRFSGSELRPACGRTRRTSPCARRLRVETLEQQRLLTAATGPEPLDLSSIQMWPDVVTAGAKAEPQRFAGPTLWSSCCVGSP